MPREPGDKSIPPALRALGGWAEAGWFDSAILQDGEIVGITLPPLPGSRKQNFELAERSAVQRAPKGRPGTGQEAAPRRVPSGIGQVLEDIGAVRAASFRRRKFFFEAPPSLYFAEIPAAQLKLRAAEALRRDLIGNDLRCCVLHSKSKTVIAMFWPKAEAEITAFIRAAVPPHGLHPAFDNAEKAVPAPARPSGRTGPKAEGSGDGGRADGAANRRLTAERDRLLDELGMLRVKLAELERLQTVAGAMEILGLDDTRLKAMLRLLHPDRHGNSEAANEAAKWINGLREVLKANKA